jgi:hypothetical protein
MSSLWTPGGERPVDRTQPTAAGEPSQEEVEAAMAQELAEIQNTPAQYIVANHAIQLFQLAQIYLTAEPPRFVDAQLSIDGMGAIVEGLHGRLGEDEATLVDGLAQMRMAFVQIKAAVDAGPPPPPES